MNTFVVSIKLKPATSELMASLVTEEDAILAAIMAEGVLAEALVLKDMSGAFLVMKGSDSAGVDTQLKRLPMYSHMDIIIDEVMPPPQF